MKGFARKAKRHNRYVLTGALVLARRTEHGVQQQHVVEVVFSLPLSIRY
jgi:hypothetical protein